MSFKKLESKNLTIVVNTCDDYSDVLEIFFKAFEKWWPNCPYPIVINTESNQYKSSFPASVHTSAYDSNTDDWGARLLSTLLEIESEFVLMVYDDFILEEKVDRDQIHKALLLLDSEEHAAVTYLINTSLPLMSSDDESLFVPIKDNIEYRLNSAPGIWRRQILMDYTFQGDNPWAWEVFGTYRTWGDGLSYYSIGPNQDDIFPYNYSKGGAIYRGKWVKEVVDKALINYPLSIDWSKRGFSSEKVYEARSLAWQIRFMHTGWKMVGFKALNFLKAYFKKKLL
tara:strand:+ start:6060 stop:6908 length:849 start_codon:yes stop_codon:yes gene_type:complete